MGKHLQDKISLIYKGILQIGERRKETSLPMEATRSRASKPLPQETDSNCLDNPMDGGAWWTAVHGVAKSQTRLSDFTFTFTFMHRRRKWQPTLVLLPGKSHGRKSLASYSSWGRKELDTTEWLHFKTRWTNRWEKTNGEGTRGVFREQVEQK